MVFWAAVQIYPLIWLVFFSFKSNEEIFGGNIAGPPLVWKVENYKNALMGGNVFRYLFNSVWVSMAVVIVACILIATSAYALSRMRWKLKKIVYWIFISGMTIPLHATLLPLFLLFRKMHIINNPLSILIPYIVFALPTGILILTNAYASLPIEMEESACIDGCNIYQLFWKIMFPLVKPTVAAIALFTFLSSWNELMFAMTFISEPKWKTLTIGLQSLSGMFYTEWGPIGAGMVVATAPVLIIYLLLNRQVQNALIMGAVKG
nr:carbohydrate ABC transporter permease [Blautia fusiformis]